MTVYAGDIKVALAFLVTTVNSVPDITRADALTRATVQKAAQTLKERISEASGTLDSQSTPGGLSAPSWGISGAFPTDTMKALAASISNCDQMAALQTMSGYVGRLQLNLAEAE